MQRLLETLLSRCGVQETVRKRREIPAAMTAEEFSRSLQLHQSAQTEYVYLSKVTGFDVDTVRKLHARFAAIDCLVAEDNCISVEEFATAVGMPSAQLLVTRLFAVMDKTGIQQIKFRNFVTTLAHLSQHSSVDEKIKLSFKLYDLNGDGCIDRRELLQMTTSALDLLQGPNSAKNQTENQIQAKVEGNGNESEVLRLSESQLQQMVEHTFAEILEANGVQSSEVVTFEQYAEFCRAKPRVLAPFTVDIESLIQAHFALNRRTVRRLSEDRTIHHGPVSPPPSARKTSSLWAPVRYEHVLSVSDCALVGADMDLLAKLKRENAAKQSADE